MSCANGSHPPGKDLASDQIAFDAINNDFVKSSKTVFQNGLPKRISWGGSGKIIE